MSLSKHNIVKGIIYALALSMTSLLIFTLVMYLFWLLRNDGVYFWVYYISKGIYSWQLGVFFILAMVLYNQFLSLLNVQLSKTEKAPSYLILFILFLGVIVGGSSESGEIFYLYGK